MIFPIRLEICSCDDNRNVCFAGEKDVMDGKRSRASKKAWTDLRLVNGAVDSRQHHTAALKMLQRLFESTHRSRDEVHARLFANLVLYLTPTLRLGNRQHQGFQPIPAQPLKDEIKVAEV